VKSTAIAPELIDPQGIYLHEGPARVFTSEDAAIAAIKSTGADAIRPGEVMVLAGIGPAVGMPETYQVTSALKYLPHGKQVALKSVDHARALGIECVYQDLALIPGLSIYHNMFLNREPLRPWPFRLLDNKSMRRRAVEALEDIGVNIPSVDEEVAMLSGGQRQAVAIARAVYSNARILLLDEPLAAMGARESGLILDLIDRLKKRGDLSLIMIAHNYAQTLEVCDRVMLFQHGEVTFQAKSAETSVPELLEVVKRNYKIVRGA